MIATRDKLIDLITVGIVRHSVQQAAGNNPDMAAIIADVLIENDYCKASDVAEEIFAEIGKILRRFDEIAERDKSEYGELIVGDITASIAELKKKYTEDNYDTDTENSTTLLSP